MTITSAERVQALYEALARTFEAHEERLNELGAVMAKPSYGTTLRHAFVEAEKAVLTQETRFGPLLAGGARALKTDAEPLLPFILFDIGRASARDDTLTLRGFQEGLRDAVTSIVRVGRVRYGEGSLLDALLPASETAQGAPTFGLALTSAASAAAEVAAQTKHPGMQAVALTLGGLADVFGNA